MYLHCSNNFVRSQSDSRCTEISPSQAKDINLFTTDFHPLNKQQTNSVGFSSTNVVGTSPLMDWTVIIDTDQTGNPSRPITYNNLPNNDPNIDLHWLLVASIYDASIRGSKLNNSVITIMFLLRNTKRMHNTSCNNPKPVKAHSFVEISPFS